MGDSIQSLSAKALLEQAPHGAVYGLDEKERVLDDVARELSRICEMACNPVVGPEIMEMVKDAGKLNVDWGTPIRSEGPRR